jgi:low temperature requirement protein LtrA
MAAADPERRPGLALAAYFYPYIPMLLGIVVLAAGLKLTIGNAAQPHPAREALALGAGVALFLAGDAMFRRALVFGAREFRRAWPRCAMAVFAGRNRRADGGASGRDGGDAAGGVALGRG